MRSSQNYASPYIATLTRHPPEIRRILRKGDESLNDQDKAKLDEWVAACKPEITAARRAHMSSDVYNNRKQ